MSGLAKWRAGPIAVLTIAWIIGSSAALIIWLLVWAHNLEKSFNAIGQRLGATEANVHVDLTAAWPQFALICGAVAVVPPSIFLFLWRRARRSTQSPLFIPER